MKTTILNQIRVLVVQASNDTYTIKDLEHIQIEIRELLDEIQRIAGVTQFNTQLLLQGKEIENKDGRTMLVNSFTFHIGPNTDNQVTLTLQDMILHSLCLADLDVALEREGSKESFGEILTAIDITVKKYQVNALT